MLIDWVTVAAQVINFLILVVLLKKFLYGPIIKAMETRREDIRRKTTEADQSRRKAEQAEEEYRNRKEELEGESQEVLEKARNKAAEEKYRLEDEARKEVAAKRDKWLSALEQQQADFIGRASREMASRAAALAGQMINELTDRDLNQLMAKAFLLKLDQLPPETEERFAGAVEAEEAVTVTSAQELSDSLKEKLQTKVGRLIQAEPLVRFEVEESLVAGLELSAGGLLVAHSVGAYLDELRENLDQALKEARPQGGKNEDRTNADAIRQSEGGAASSNVGESHA